MLLQAQCTSREDDQLKTNRETDQGTLEFQEEKKIDLITKFSQEKQDDGIMFGYEYFCKGFQTAETANVEKAMKHRQAFKSKQIELDTINYEICECCNTPIYGEQYPISCSINQLADLGIGFGLYFIYIKFLIILLVIAAFPFGLTILIYCCFQDNIEQ